MASQISLHDQEDVFLAENFLLTVPIFELIESAFGLGLFFPEIECILRNNWHTDKSDVGGRFSRASRNSPTHPARLLQALNRADELAR